MRLQRLRTLALVPSLLLFVPLAACSGPPAIKVVDKPPPQRLLNPCLRPDDKPNTEDDRVLASWVTETWERGHICADKVDGWIEWKAGK